MHRGWAWLVSSWRIREMKKPVLTSGLQQSFAIFNIQYLSLEIVGSSDIALITCAPQSVPIY